MVSDYVVHERPVLGGRVRVRARKRLAHALGDPRDARDGREMHRVARASLCDVCHTHPR
jgi:hypothetical protein